MLALWAARILSGDVPSMHAVATRLSGSVMANRTHTAIERRLSGRILPEARVRVAEKKIG